MAVKNMVMGAPLAPALGNNNYADSEKRKFHVGIRSGNYNMFLAIQKMLPINWGVGVVDGYEGMEGNGPMSGTPVGHRNRLGLHGFLAVDRVGLECMGIDASWPGYLNYAYQAGLGQYDSDQDRRAGRQDRRRAEEVTAARRHGSNAGVARPHAGPAVEPGPQPASRRRRPFPVRVRAVSIQLCAWGRACSAPAPRPDR